MRSKFKWIFTLLLALSLQFSFAQEKTVSGVVSDKSGPLPGANVVVKGTTRSAQTDFDGKYSIKAKAGEVLVISFTGYNDSTVAVGAANSYNVSLKEQSVKLEEVVIDGYRSTSKAKSSVAQTTILAKTIENRPNVSFVQSLQGQVPGLQISTSSGQPGSNKVESLIRGVSSINGSTEPLIVIDGIPSSQGVFRSINANDIESATVLKDAAATSIYGTRGAGGVIVVKTKRGKYDSKLTVKYSGSYGMQELQQNEYDIVNTKQALTLERTWNQGVGLGATGGVGGGPMTDAEIAAYPINTNWRDYFFRKGTSQSHDLSISGGTAKTTNYTSFGYFQQDGIVPTTDFQRFSVRSNFEGKSANDKFTYSTNIYGSFSKRHQLDQETRTDINANVLQNPLQGLLTSLPYTDPSLYVNGAQLNADFGAPSFQIVPYMLMDYLVPGNIPSQWDETKLLVNASGSYKLTKDLTFTSTAGIDYAQEFRDFARAPWSYLAIIATPVGAEFGGIETQTTNRDFSFNLTNKLNYNHTFKEKHTIDLNFFTDYLKLHRQFFGRTQNGLDPRTWAFGAGTGYIGFNPATPNFYVPTISHLAGGRDKIDAGMFSYFSTFSYDYDSRFGIDATIRRDASYKFIGDNQWGTFWSVAGRWNLDKEKFIQNTIFDELKLRASYGTNGNQNIPAVASGVNPFYAGFNLVRDTNQLVAANAGGGYSNLPALGVGVLANSTIKWEVTTQLDFGFDFSIAKRFSGSVDFYKKQTDDLFDDINISAVTGQLTIDGNTGSIRNTGVEALFKYDVFKKGDFKFDVFVNGAYNRAIYLTTGSGIDEPSGNLIRSAGQLINQYYVVPYIGVNNNGFIDADGVAQPADGNLLFLDINGNVTETISDDDRRKSNKSTYPRYQGGFGFNASYKGFFLNTQFTYAKDVWRFDFDLTNMSDPTAIGIFAVTNDLNNAWDATTNPTSNYPSLNATNLVDGDTFSDRWLTDASYIRLKVLTYGYNVPSKFLEKSSISSLRFYSTMENYVTWTKWRGFDPESSGASNQGGYPSPKAITFGVDIQF
jgi:TonB-linked SusC/RagA family outer membrane protein